MSDDLGTARWTAILALGEEPEQPAPADPVGEEGEWRGACFDGSWWVERALERARLVCAPSRTVVGLGRRPVRWGSMVERHPGLHLALQCQRAGTGTAVLMAATWIARRCPDAVVALLPSDQLVSDDLRFMAHVREAMAWVERRPEKLVLLGAEPTCGCEGGGWIVPDGREREPWAPFPAEMVSGHDAFRPADLVERGAYVSTDVVVGTVGKVLAVASALAPAWSRAVADLMAPDEDVPHIARGSLAPLDFIRDIVARAHGHVACLAVHDVLWSSVSRPCRPHRARLQAEAVQ